MRRLSTERNALLVTIVFLAAIGIAVPYLDDQTLRTLLVVAGVGLACLLAINPSVPETTRKVQSFSRTARSSEIRFAELGAERAATSNIDRAAWARLTTQMSHELRTPLNAVLGFSEMMSNEVFGPLGSSCYGAYARDIHSSGRLLLKSAEDALSITALLTGCERKSSTACLRQAVDEAAAFLDFDLAKLQITLDCALSTGTEVVAEPQAARQVLINLLADLIAKADRGATLRVRAESTVRGVHLSLTLDRAASTPREGGDTFCTSLARTLCELAGADLSPETIVGGRIERSICFLPAAQNDLFGR